MSIPQENTCAACEEKYVYQRQQRGRRSLYCSAECRNRQYGTDKTVATIKCRNCGKEFICRGKTIRVCCSKSCAITDIIRQAKVYLNSEPSRGEFRAWVLSLCSGGYGYAATADALGLNRLTVQSWIARSKGKKESQQSRRYLKFSFINAKSDTEWLEMLRTEVAPPKDNVETITGNRPIVIICDTVGAKKGSWQLSTIIEGRLRMNPFDGSVYAFCGKERDSIRCLFWDGTEFCVITHNRSGGTYPWPAPQLGAAISVSPDDFSLILRGHKKYSTIGLGWESINISDAKQQGAKHCKKPENA